MKFAFIALVLASGLVGAHAGKAPANALNKVISIVERLKAKIDNENQRQAIMNTNYLNWCTEERTTSEGILRRAYIEQGQFLVKLEEAQNAINNANEIIGVITSRLASNNKDLEEATAEREAKNKEFLEAEEALNGAIFSLGQAVKLIGDEIKQHRQGAVFAQIDTAALDKLLTTVGAMMDAVSVASANHQQLLGLIQTSHELVNGERDADVDEQPNAPSATVYKAGSEGILDTLEDMKEKAIRERNEQQKAELKDAHTYDMTKKTLEEAIATDTKLLEDKQKDLNEALQERAEINGELTRINATIEYHEVNLKHLGQDCFIWKQDYEKFQQDQQNEFEALTACEEAVQHAMGNLTGTRSEEEEGASFIEESTTNTPEAPDDAPPSLLQVQEGTSLDEGSREVVQIVRDLAVKQHSKSLMQLSSRIKTILRYGGADGEDPFAKVKGLISDMIADLTKKIQEETTEKIFCDNEMARMKSDLEELGINIADLDAAYEAALTKEMFMQKSYDETQAAMQKALDAWNNLYNLHANQTKDHVVTETELKQGLAAIRQAISTMRTFYGVAEPEAPVMNMPQPPKWTPEAGTSLLQVKQMPEEDRIPKLVAAKSTVQAKGIIELLELIAEDLAKSLSEEGRRWYDIKRLFQDNEDEYKAGKTKNEQDMAHFHLEAASAIRNKREYGDEEADKKKLQETSVSSYYQLKARCEGLPQKYADRKAHRESEIQGLRTALEVLEDETAYSNPAMMQTKAKRLRGLRRHA